MKKTRFTLPAILCTTILNVGAASLTFVERVQVSSNNANFDLSVTPGHASYNDRGIGGSEPGSASFRNVLGDGTLESWNLFGNNGNGSELTTYSSSGTRTPTPVRSGPTASTHGTGEDWANVWTSSVPGTGIDFAGGAPKDHNPTGVAGAANTFARVVSLDGTIDISGMSSGQIYFPVGSFNNGWSLELIMSGPGQPDLTAEDGIANGVLGNTNQGWIEEFAFTNEGQYDTITYLWRHNDLDGSPGSRARFAGVMLDGVVGGGGPGGAIQITSVEFDPVAEEFTVTWESALPGPFNIHMGTGAELEAAANSPSGLLDLVISGVTSPAVVPIPAENSGARQLFLQVSQ